MADESIMLRDGVVWIRAADAVRRLGIADGNRPRWERMGIVRSLRLAQSPRWAASAPVAVWWALEDVDRIERQRQVRRDRRPWSSADDELILDRVGRSPLTAIADDLGRSVHAVLCRIYRLGVGERSNQGDWTPGQIGQLCGVCRNTVTRWCTRRRDPLRCRRIPNGRRDRQIRLPDLVAWLRRHPRTMGLLPHKTIIRLKLDQPAGDVSSSPTAGLVGLIDLELVKGVVA